jgi:hypothetical protein
MKAVMGLALALGLVACDPGSGDTPKADAEAVVANEVAAASADPAEPETSKAQACLFRETENWKGSIEGGRLLVTGTVDLQMAGMKPQLTERPRAGSGAMAFDLALVPAAGEPVTDKARYERSGVAAARTGEIYCGGERIASFDMIVL